MASLPDTADLGGLGHTCHVTEHLKGHDEVQAIRMPVSSKELYFKI